MESVKKGDLKKLSRGELLDIIFQLKKNEESLRQKLSEAQDRLKEREILMKEAGSIAEASLALNDVFGAAQRAVDTYTNSVRLSCSRMEEEGARAELERRQMLENAQAEADKILKDARAQGARMVEEAEEAVRERKMAFQRTVKRMLFAHPELKTLMEQRR